MDLIEGCSFRYEGSKGETVVRGEIPETLQELYAEQRAELIGAIAEVDDEVGELFVCDEPIPNELLKKAIRRATIANLFVPVFMGMCGCGCIVDVRALY